MYHLKRAIWKLLKQPQYITFCKNSQLKVQEETFPLSPSYQLLIQILPSNRLMWRGHTFSYQRNGADIYKKSIAGLAAFWPMPRARQRINMLLC